MTAAELVAEASHRGIRLEVDGDGLGYRSPVGDLTAELRGVLVARKAEVLRLLIAPSADVLSDEPCLACGSHERWRWLDGQFICRSCLIRG
jgi:TubC N-terminal docking domain/Zinc-finger of RNA-polymerase I-specific TFIIB, Rrn7